MSGAAIKKIAVITMLIDHIGAAFFYVFTSGYDGGAAFAGADVIYDVLRVVGRTSFPLFCFLLVEGFLHTRSVGRYLLRLLLFAVISEVPFDLAFNDTPWDLTMQNVFFTLLLGVLAMAAIRWGEQEQSQEDRSQTKQSPMRRRKLRRSVGWLLAALCMIAAYLLRTDYDARGVILILVLYVLRRQRVMSCLAGYAVMCFGMLESWSFPAFFLIPHYNGEKGHGAKYFFYVFYPVHLLVLAGIRIWYLNYL